LFMSGARIETSAAPRRAIGLAFAVLIAYKTKSALTGMIAGAVLVLILSRLF
jgi:branched-subunit amino acid transport protein